MLEGEHNDRISNDIVNEIFSPTQKRNADKLCDKGEVLRDGLLC